MATTKPNITVIPAKMPQVMTGTATPAFKRKAAGYARVSSDSDEQLNSYEAQVNYYTSYIKSRPDWEFVGVYTDEGISAVSTKKREGFKKMISDALDGKIDLIVTKSVSRFARNTVDSLITIRQLKEAKVECYFEKEAIWTFDGKGELLLTIMSSLAQEESRSISENVTWGKRKSMADGHICLPYKIFLGYEKGLDGYPAVVPEEAKTVRLIYRLFMMGKTYSAIARHLTDEGILTPQGLNGWKPITVRNILTNETYKGCKRLQKTFVTDYLSKSTKANEGELPSYYIKDSHEPIIDPDEWDAVQAEVARRKAIGRPVSCQSPLSTKVVCGDCGGYFGSKVWGSNTIYRKVIWRCNDRYNIRGKRDCQTSHVKEADVKEKFLLAFNQLLMDRGRIIQDCQEAQSLLCDTTLIDAEIAELERELEVNESLLRESIQENARQVVDQSQWMERNGVYLNMHSQAVKRLSELDKLKDERRGKSQTINLFIKNLKASKRAVTEFDDGIWSAAIDCVVVQVDGALTFRFKDGTEINV